SNQPKGSSFMRHRLAIILASTAAMGSLGIVGARASGGDALLTVPGYSINVDPTSDQTVVVDGHTDQGEPMSGYAVVHRSGRVTCGEHGDGPYNDDGTARSDWNDGQPGNEENASCA